MRWPMDIRPNTQIKEINLIRFTILKRCQGISSPCDTLATTNRVTVNFYGHGHVTENVS